MLEHLRLLSRYNQWMNDKLYNTAAQLPADELARNRGAFSIIATGIGCWRNRFAGVDNIGVTGNYWLKP